MRAPTPSHDNRRGILLMCAAMAGFAVEDMFIKIAAGGLTAGQILALLGLAGSVTFVIAARRIGVPVLSMDALRGPMLVRNLTEVASATMFIFALTIVPLSVYSAVLQAAPLFVVLGAMLWLGETVRWRRWTAILAGFAGVLLIIRPDAAGFDPMVLLVVLATALMSVRDLVTRRVPARVSSVQLAAWAFLGVFAAGLAIVLWEGSLSPPPPAALPPVMAAMALGTFSYFLLIRAMRAGEVSVIAPFRYTRIVFALALAVIVLGERPDGLTLLGTAIVTLAGLYTLLREARLRAEKPPSPDAEGKV